MGTLPKLPENSVPLQTSRRSHEQDNRAETNREPSPQEEAARKSYINAVSAKIRKQWDKISRNIPPNSASITIFKFVVTRNGTLGEIELVQSSGRERADSLAMNSIQSSAPFELIPLEIKDPWLEITMGFNYNSFSVSDR